MALISIKGVLLDGAGTQVPSLQPIQLYAQDTTISLVVTGQGGAPINLTGYTAALQFKAGPVLAPYPGVILPGTVTAPLTGTVTFTMSRVLIKGLQYPSYLYDVYITSAGLLSDEVVVTSMMTNNLSLGA